MQYDDICRATDQNSSGWQIICCCRTIWNSLPADLRLVDNYARFRRLLDICLAKAAAPSDSLFLGRRVQLYLLTLRHNKSNMADGRHIENRLLAISLRFIVRLMWNWVRRSPIMFRHRLSDQISNFRKFKMADGRNFEYFYIYVTYVFLLIYHSNFVCKIFEIFDFKNAVTLKNPG